MTEDKTPDPGALGKVREILLSITDSYSADAYLAIKALALLDGMGVPEGYVPPAGESVEALLAKVPDHLSYRLTRELMAPQGFQHLCVLFDRNKGKEVASEFGSTPAAAIRAAIEKETNK